MKEAMAGPMMRMPNMTCCMSAFAERKPWRGTADLIATPCAGEKKLETMLIPAKMA